MSNCNSCSIMSLKLDELWDRKDSPVTQVSAELDWTEPQLLQVHPFSVSGPHCTLLENMGPSVVPSGKPI